MKKIFLIIMIITISEILPQQKNADELINSVISNFNRVQDYEVDIEIKVDVDFLKVPDSKAKIFFKQPDKIKLKSEKEIALIPGNEYLLLRPESKVRIIGKIKV